MILFWKIKLVSRSTQEGTFLTDLLPDLVITPPPV